MTELVRAGEPSDLIGRLAAAFIKTKRGHTADAYRRDLTLWTGWCHTHQLDPLHAGSDHVRAWLDSRNEAGTTRARRLAAVSAWYRWLTEEGHHTGGNPADLPHDVRPTREPRAASALTREHAAALLAAADSESQRASVVVWLLLHTGIRVGELLAANVSDWDGRVLRVAGRAVHVPAAAAARLNAYLAGRDDTGGARPLVAWATGHRMARSNIRVLVRRVAGKAGLPAAVVARLSPEGLRATHRALARFSVATEEG